MANIFTENQQWYQENPGSYHQFQGPISTALPLAAGDGLGRVGPTMERFGAKFPVEAAFRKSRKDAFDIVNDYDWTTIPRRSPLRDEAPCAYVTAYELEFSQLQAFVDGYLSLAASSLNTSNPNVKDPGLEFYKNIYKATKQLGNFNFPFFSEDIRSFTSEFQDTFTSISQRGAKFLGADFAETLAGVGEEVIGGTIALRKDMGDMGGNAIADKVASIGKAGEGFVAKGFERLTGQKMPGMQTVGAPGSYIETPKFYQYSNTDNALEISFALANTIENDGEARNSEFIKYFTTINRPRRLGAIAMTYPAIYHIEVPGQRYIEWAYLENFQVGLLGTRRRIGRKIIPEAYSCNFSFRSLTIEAANFMDKIYDTQAFDEGDANYLRLRAESDAQREKHAAIVKKQIDLALGGGPKDPEPVVVVDTSPYPDISRGGDLLTGINNNSTDSDNDGYTDLEEIRARTDPRDPNDKPDPTKPPGETTDFTGGPQIQKDQYGVPAPSGHSTMDRRSVTDWQKRYYPGEYKKAHPEWNFLPPLNARDRAEKAAAEEAAADPRRDEQGYLPEEPRMDQFQTHGTGEGIPGSPEWLKKNPGAIMSEHPELGELWYTQEELREAREQGLTEEQQARLNAVRRDRYMKEAAAATEAARRQAEIDAAQEVINQRSRDEISGAVNVRGSEAWHRANPGAIQTEDQSRPAGLLTWYTLDELEDIRGSETWQGAFPDAVFSADPFSESMDQQWWTQAELQAAGTPRAEQVRRGRQEREAREAAARSLEAAANVRGSEEWQRAYPGASRALDPRAQHAGKGASYYHGLRWWTPAELLEATQEAEVWELKPE